MQYESSDSVFVQSGQSMINIGYHEIDGAPTRAYYMYLPEGTGAGSPVIVSVHGISRNAAEHIFRLRAMAKQAGAVLVAPLFGKRDYGKYQRLEDPVTGVRSDLALIDILDHVAKTTGADSSRVHICGFSGGAQFAHRFAMFHADRVRSCVVMAAGWYSFPDMQMAYPLGTASGSGPAGLSLHAEWDRVPMHVIVGTRDRISDGSVNDAPEIVEVQGSHRLQRARRWHRAMQAHRDVTRDEGAGAVSLTEVQDLGHDFGGGVDQFDLDRLVFEKFELIKKEQG